MVSWGTFSISQSLNFSENEESHTITQCPHWTLTAVTAATVTAYFHVGSPSYFLLTALYALIFNSYSCLAGMCIDLHITDEDTEGQRAN